MTKSRGINAPRHVWTPDEKLYLEVFYPDTAAKVLADKLHLELTAVYAAARRFGFTKSEAFKASSASGRLDGVRGSQTRFQKGHVSNSPWVKGQRVGMATEFKKGQVPPNRQEVGALRINSMGDIDIKVAPGPGQWVSLRRYVWEREHGPIPPAMCVVPDNGDGHDTRIGNLKLVTRAENICINLLRKYPKELRNAMALKGRLSNQIARSQEALNV